MTMQKVALLVVALSVVIGLAAAAAPKWHELESTNYDFVAYVRDFNRQYDAKEYAMRKAIFDGRLASIKAHNKDLTKSWKEGVNHLTDKTDAELKQMNGYNKALALSMPRSGIPYQHKGLGLPGHVDWRDNGIISAVKDQGQCGSCWTFGTAETVESYWALAHGGLPVLSEQQILDCTDNSNHCGGTGGCGGGTAELAMRQIINQGGLSAEWTYPYQSYWGNNFDKCSFNSSRTPPYAQLKNYVNLPVNKYEPILEAVAHEGPLIINVDASAWSKYEAGVFDGCNQTHPDIDHVVQLVGYGEDRRDGPYWLVRNSWTPKWGEEGYIRLKRRSTPLCGIDLNPQDGTGCNGGPPQVTVCGTCGILFDALYPIVAEKKN